MRRLALICTLAVLAGCGEGAPAAPPPAPARDLPRLRLGMTLEEAKKAVGDEFRVLAEPGGECASFSAPHGLEGLALRGRIAVIQFEAVTGDNLEKLAPGPATDRGLRGGDGLERAITLYGRPHTIGADEYRGQDVFWRLPDIGRKHVWLRLTIPATDGPPWHQVGMAPAIHWAEGCL